MSRSRRSITTLLTLALAGPFAGGCSDLPTSTDENLVRPAGALAASATRSVAPNAVTDWAVIVQRTIHNPAAPRPPGSSQILFAMAQLAVYDAVMAIEGGYEPFAADIDPAPDSDVRAAVATAAYLTAVERVAASERPGLTAQYSAYVGAIPDGPAKSDGIRVGEEAAAAMLALRADDGFDRVVNYECTSVPPEIGEFEPNAGCGTQPVDAKLGQVRPYTFDDPTRFRPDGPSPLESREYARDFVETRDYGAVNSTVRTDEQKDVAYFWSEHALVHWNRNLIGLAEHYLLDIRQTARLFAMAHTAAADAVIAGFDAKYFFRHWRPRTAIPLADADGNPRTPADPSWAPLLSVNHPEYPSAHGFWSTALTDAVADFFRTTRVSWTIKTDPAAVPQVVRTERSYSNLNAISRDIDDARVWAGLHWRSSMRDGNQIGRKVAKHVTGRCFRPTHSRDSHWSAGGPAGVDGASTFGASRRSRTCVNWHEH
jgi:hypothetical protein